MFPLLVPPLLSRMRPAVLCLIPLLEPPQSSWMRPAELIPCLPLLLVPLLIWWVRPAGLAGEAVVEDDDLPPLLDDVDLGGEDEESSSEEDSTPPIRTSAREKRPNTMLRDYVLFAEGKESSEPNTLAEAQARSDWPHWKAAMDEEMKSLLENRTWDLEELPKSAKKIGLKWV
ncbi:hypothetical protein Vretimale_4171 [Volvox reticuliferus]|uniref:Uncharacterized protein n=1 Tax=Volvox reticuliferus TaxID=1737510 RepID=A0A8J4BZ80_9CHLO|nr:hypothetical protein Vretifemale_2843 [Volvox reticuliferus]GIL98972.1 hypothetical protein Vretimale_4171 [Volvox reticuliferus]